MFYGDGMITPAISVLGAVEGLEVITPLLHPFIVPVTLAILIGLFWIQRRGTASVGALLRPGLPRLVRRRWRCSGCYADRARARRILAALLAARTPSTSWSRNPTGDVPVAGRGRARGDGHRGALRRHGALRRVADPPGVVLFVLPALVLNYFGQGALLLGNPAAVKNPFYLLAPQWAAAAAGDPGDLAAVIASQAVISGAFSLTRQAIQMGYCPRLKLLHTSEREIGQIYVPFINWTLLVAVDRCWCWASAAPTTWPPRTASRSRWRC